MTAAEFIIPVPATRADWEAQRPDIRARLWQLLGDLPPLFTPALHILRREACPGGTLASFTFDNGAGATVYGDLLIPDGRRGPGPAVLYQHMHGGKYHIGRSELFQDWLCGTAPGPALLRAGYVVLAIDAYGFGARWSQGPRGPQDSGIDTENALFKRFLWEGRTLWGMMLRDDLLALNALLACPEVDAARVGLTGMSLGGSRSTWLAALDDRPKGVIPVAQMTRYRDFLAAGHLNQHSIYYYVPGVLRQPIEMELLTALAAPRPQHILIGADDPLSPLAGVQTIIRFTEQIYRLYDAPQQFTAFIEPGVGHKYTPAMFRAVLAAFQQWL
ncbi:MAG: acetylxylan esterase [Anaerolineae bacterium]|jgi:dienelactone hydrolase|nr:acetylxylan esterase [Anaerolineae bacterium]